MTTKEFIEKAIEGGWNPSESVYGMKLKKSTVHAQMAVAGEFYKAWFLDPLAWQAVGRVEGWDDEPLEQEWLDAMHGMIESLASGQTTEEFLATL